MQTSGGYEVTAGDYVIDYPSENIYQVGERWHAPLPSSESAAYRIIKQRMANTGIWPNVFTVNFSGLVDRICIWGCAEVA